MTTQFTQLPIVDLSPLHAATPSPNDLERLARELHSVFSTVGFAYLTNVPLSLPEDAVFGLARGFFAMPEEEKMKLAKQTFRKQHSNTYRGFFPAQAGSDNLKEGFEVGPEARRAPSSKPSNSPFVLTEPNVWPPSAQFKGREQTQELHTELQSLATTLLTLLATSLGKPADTFTRLLRDSVSTLRLLHYPSPAPPAPQQQELCCTPHTDSGLVTLLRQDPTGGLEVRNAAGEWIPAPYVKDSVVVNIGDLMAQMSGGRFVATQHRVRSSGKERYSVPFFCEPGVDAMVGEAGKEVRYEDFVLGKMGMWIEFQDPVPEDEVLGKSGAVEMSVGA